MNDSGRDHSTLFRDEFERHVVDGRCPFDDDLGGHVALAGARRREDA